MPVEAVYRLEKGRNVIKITDDVEKPNGLALSPDQRTLYLADHNNGGNRLSPKDPEPKRGAMKVYAFPLDENGRANGRRRTLVDFGKENGCDGMRVDSRGNLILAIRSLARPGLLFIDPTGKELAFLPTGPTNQSGLFGFHFELPRGLLPPLGSQHRVRIFAVRLGVASELPVKPGWPWRSCRRRG